jgi:hypothetical protein
VSKYRIQHYTTSVTIPAGSGSVSDVLAHDLNGLVRGLVITPPASLTGSSYSVTVSGYYTLSSLSAGSKEIAINDANNNPLQFPVASKAGDSWLTISVPSDTGATGTLTSDTTNVSNNDTVTIGSRVYTFKTSLTEVYATGTVTDGNATNVSDGDTITIGSTTYRFKNTMAQVNDVQIGASADASAQSLIYAINGAGTPSSDYYTGTTANASASAGTLASHAFTVTAKTLGTAGNLVAFSTTSTHLTLGNNTGSHLNGGVNSVANEVKVDGSSADTSLGNLVAAINSASGAGTKYSTATPANTDVSAGTVTSHATVVTALSETIAGDSIVTTTTASHLSWGAATLSGSGESVDRVFVIDAYIER